MADFDAVTLTSPEGLTATYVPEAGMVGASLRAGSDELLGRRRGLEAYAAEGKTMGIPFLHPWANRLAADDYAADGIDVRLAANAPGLRRDGNGLPIHGLLAGARGWRVEQRSDTRLVAGFDFGARPELLASFPFPHRLRMAVALNGRTLTVETTLAATGDVPVPVTYGFHPYLRLPDAPRAEWEIELPAMRSLALDDRGIPTGAGTPVAAFDGRLGGRAYDDAFALDGTAAQGASSGEHAPPGDAPPGDAPPGDAPLGERAPLARFAVSGGDRRIEVRFERGFPAAQVYAPLDDDVVCFEPMTAPTNALRAGGYRTVAPGAEDVTSFSIAVWP